MMTENMQSNESTIESEAHVTEDTVELSVLASSESTSSFAIRCNIVRGCIKFMAERGFMQLVNDRSFRERDSDEEKTDDSFVRLAGKIITYLIEQNAYTITSQFNQNDGIEFSFVAMNIPFVLYFGSEHFHKEYLVMNTDVNSPSALLPALLNEIEALKKELMRVRETIVYKVSPFELLMDSMNKNTFNAGNDIRTFPFYIELHDSDIIGANGFNKRILDLCQSHLNQKQKSTILSTMGVYERKVDSSPYVVKEGYTVTNDRIDHKHILLRVTHHFRFVDNHALSEIYYSCGSHDTTTCHVRCVDGIYQIDGQLKDSNASLEQWNEVLSSQRHVVGKMNELLPSLKSPSFVMWVRASMGRGIPTIPSVEYNKRVASYRTQANNRNKEYLETLYSRKYKVYCHFEILQRAVSLVFEEAFSTDGRVSYFSSESMVRDQEMRKMDDPKGPAPLYSGSTFRLPLFAM
eukprot:182354_1